MNQEHWLRGTNSIDSRRYQGIQASKMVMFHDLKLYLSYVSIGTLISMIQEGKASMKQGRI
jgi:hypothetical protein